MQDLLCSDEINEAMKLLIEMSSNEEDREFYNQRQLAILDHNSSLARAKRLGIEKGIEQGIEQGIKQGIKQGIEKDIKQWKIETIVRMLEDLTDEQISKYTRTAIEEIKQIRETKNKGG